ncbi:iron-sulfur cluster assembly accessory protein [Rhabdochlamydiaceae symbiont of Dictyostelium giganteum]|uniref:iron-sulfur cluster assembly accessory protein n=1 Tax=Rhabdochlamydiaceae symbiont of Dictyostelium giganteum TaxID=3342349 RepID=UPI00384D3D0D
MTDQITKEMTIEQILTAFPQRSQKLAQEMMNAGLNCVGCGAAVWETLEGGVLGHGFNEEHLEKLLAKLNLILQEKIDLSTITLSPRAAEKYKEILEDEGKEGWGLRFADRAGGCSGFEYVLDYSEAPSEEDAVFHSEGVEIHIQKNSVDRLKGCVIDFVDGLNGSGFKITNPNVKGSCGCGKSQSY